MHDITDDIKKLNLSTSLTNKLKEKNLNTIQDVWILKRKELKTIGFSDPEIKSIVISLQLEGLDLNKKKYN